MQDDADRRGMLPLKNSKADGTSRSTAPHAEAARDLDAVLAKLAAPGMSQPHDEARCVDGEPDASTCTRCRAAQHDALKAMGRSVSIGRVGQAQRAACTIIVSTSCRSSVRCPAWPPPCGTAADARRDQATSRSITIGYLRQHTRESLYRGRANASRLPVNASYCTRSTVAALGSGCTAPATGVSPPCRRLGACRWETRSTSPPGRGRQPPGRRGWLDHSKTQ